MEGLRDAFRGIVGAAVNEPADSRAFADKSALINRKLDRSTITVRRNTQNERPLERRRLMRESLIAL
jgi:hypothetical protein